jgi:hypothetical protein
MHSQSTIIDIQSGGHRYLFIDELHFVSEIAKSNFEFSIV